MAASVGLDVGETAPRFTGSLVTSDSEVRELSLSDLYGEKPVLLSFYTADFMPDCIDEWCSFRDFGWFSSGEHVSVVGCSKSPAWLHRRFIEYLDIDFPLYSDSSLELAEKFHVRYRALKVSPRARRSCFLVDTDGEVKYKWISQHPLDPSRDTPPLSDVYEAVQAALDLSNPESFGFGES